MQHHKLNNILRHRERRQSLRNNPTSAEKYLWTILKSKQIMGRKFRRQHGIGSYIVDFYCPSEKLIIELDGEIHDDPEQIIYDVRRNQFLERNGFKILRFKNELVFCNVPEVIRMIQAEFKAG